MKIKLEVDLIPSALLPGVHAAWGKYSYDCCLCKKKTQEPGYSYIGEVLGKEIVVCVCDKCREKYNN